MAAVIPYPTEDMTGGWYDIYRFCKYQQPDLIYVAIGCSQKRHEYGKHSPQECPPFVRDWIARVGESALAVCILIDPDLEEDLYVLRDLTDDELAHTKIITARRELCWSNLDDKAFIRSLCDLAVNEPDTYLIVQDYSGEDIRRHYPLDWFDRSTLLRKVVFDVGFMEGGCWLDFDKVRLKRDADGGFLQPPYMPLSSAIAIASPELSISAGEAEVIRFLAERRYYMLVSYVFGYYRHPAERDWCNAEAVAQKFREIAATEAYGVPVSITKENLKLLATRMVEDFARTAGAEITAAEIADMLDEPTEKVLPAAVCTLRSIINEMVATSP